MPVVGGGQDRLSVVIRPLDLAFSIIKFILIPAVVAVASVELLQTILELFIKTPSRLLLIALLVALVLYVPILQIPPVAKRINHMLNATRRWIVTSCTLGRSQGRPRISCRLTPAYLRTWTFQYDSQREAVELLVDAAIGSSGSDFWLVEGPSGAGKTRCAQLLVAALIRDPRHFELANRIFLYDFSTSEEIQRDLVRRLGTPRHDDAIVVIDNFQQVNAATIRSLTRTLLDQPGRSVERLFIILARPHDAWLLPSGTEVRLVSEAKRAGHFISISGADAGTLTNDVYDVDPVASELLTDLSLRRIASATQLHAAQVIATSGKASPEVIAMLRLLAGKRDHGASTELIMLLGIVSALSAYRGSFTSKEFRLAVSHMTGEPKHLVGWTNEIRLPLLLRRLRRLGLLPKMRIDGTHYIFHEAIADLCIDRLTLIPSFEGPFRQTVLMRLAGRLRAETHVIQWMLASEIGAEQVMRGCFDAAAESGTFRPMVSCLERCSKRIPFSDDVRLQFAILLDRVGKFAASRSMIDGETAINLAPDSQLAAQLVIARTEVTHDERVEAGLEFLRNGSDRSVSLTARYWEIHMNAHRGVFDPDELFLLGSEMVSLASDRPNYFMLSSMARMHFDGLRQLYLTGRATPHLVYTSTTGIQARYLRNRLPTYEALTTLYTKAHLLGHVLLPRVAIFNDRVTYADAGISGHPDEQVGVSALVEATKAQYLKARDEFWQFGDREAQYLQADLLNAELLSTEVDFGRVESLLLEYRYFIQSIGFGDMASYPYLYFCRWNVLKRFALLLNPVPDLRTADEYLEEAHRCLRFAESLDEKVSNKYGLFRVRLLRLLLDAMRTPLRAAVINELRGQAEASEYRLEGRLLRHLRDQPALRPADLQQIFRFYPIVHQ